MVYVTLSSDSKDKWWIRKNTAIILEGPEHLQGHRKQWLCLSSSYSHTKIGVQKILCPWLIYNIFRFEKLYKESREVSSNLVTLSEKLDLGLQDNDFIELLAVKPRCLPNGTGSSEKGRWGTKGRNNWRTEEIHDSGKGEGMLFIWGGTVSFWARWPGLRKAHGVFSRCSECPPVLLCHL